MEGAEVVAVCATGEIVVASRHEGGFRAEVVARAGGEMIQLAVGDADRNRAGLEIVVVGMERGDEEAGGNGAAHLVAWSGERWVCEQIAVSEALLHGVCIADLDPSLPGDEILAVGYANRALLIRRDADRWTTTAVADLGSRGKNAIPFRGGAAVATTTGALLHVRKLGDAWRVDTLVKAAAGLARLATDGERILAAADDGTLLLVAGGETEVLCKEGAKMRGAVLADIDAEAPGLEAATAGYEGRVTLLRLVAGGWRAEVVFAGTEKLHHLAAGELDASSPGLELVTCGYAKKLLLLRRPAKG
jgi:hypothetical protein